MVRKTNFPIKYEWVPGDKVTGNIVYINDEYSIETNLPLNESNVGLVVSIAGRILAKAAKAKEKANEKNGKLTKAA